MLKFKPNLFPSGGYYFVESDKSVFRGGNWNQVAKKVREYRERKGIPVGDIVAEITQQACSRNPNQCFDDVNKRVPPQPVSLKSKVFKWLFGFTSLIEGGQKLAYVTPEEAETRSKVCAGCVNNVKSGVSSCSSCKQSIAESRKTIIGASRQRFDRLESCAVLAADLKTAVHLDEIRIDNPALPAHCWRKRQV